MIHELCVLFSLSSVMTYVVEYFTIHVTPRYHDQYGTFIQIYTTFICPPCPSQCSTSLQPFYHALS